eukprot:4985376-Pyramimonas_sp.AAC.1
MRGAAETAPAQHDEGGRREGREGRRGAGVPGDAACPGPNRALPGARLGGRSSASSSGTGPSRKG